MNAVLVLNADMNPLTLCSVERAFLLIYLKKAEIVSSLDDKKLHSVNETFDYPSVIKVHQFVSLPYKGVILSRQNIFKRDNHECQYCGTSKDLTLDHLIPKSKGGKSTWTNLVTACKRCNARKGDFKPEDLGMNLKSKPIRPSYLMFLKQSYKAKRHDWAPYL